MTLIANILLVSITSYLVGAIPASFIMGKLARGIDLREHGSGNLGAANTFRVLGSGAAIPVLLFDIGKGFFAVWFISGLGGANIWFALLSAASPEARGLARRRGPFSLSLRTPFCSASLYGSLRSF